MELQLLRLGTVCETWGISLRRNPKGVDISVIRLVLAALGNSYRLKFEHQALATHMGPSVNSGGGETAQAVLVEAGGSLNSWLVATMAATQESQHMSRPVSRATVRVRTGPLGGLQLSRELPPSTDSMAGGLHHFFG